MEGLEAVADPKTMDAGEVAERQDKLRQLAYKADAKRPDDVSEVEWRRARSDAGHMVVIRSHFKSIFLIPMAILSVVVGIGAAFSGDSGDRSWGLLWSLAFMFYMNIFIFEWTRAWTVALISAICVFVALGFAVNSEAFPIWHYLRTFFGALNLQQSGQSYFFFAGFFGFCSLVSWIKTRFNYVVIEHNEMQVYRNAFFGDRERISMLNPSIEVVIPDMIEYYHPFYQAGTVIIHAPAKTILLENVLHIRKIESLTDKIGSSLAVHIEGGEGTRPESKGSSAHK